MLESARLHPEDPTPWAYLIMVAVYLQDGEEGEDAYFREAIRRDPDHWTTHMHRLTSLTEKYGGSHQQMFEFVRTVAASAPAGSLLPALVLKAHSEYWKYLDLFEGRGDDAIAYRNNENAKAEAREMYHASLGSHLYPTRESLFARINAAGWFWLVGDLELLKRELDALGNSLRDAHWTWVGVAGVRQARKAAKEA